MSSAIIYIDLNNKILLMNKKTEDFLGADAKKDFLVLIQVYRQK